MPGPALKRVEELFHQALALDPAQRPAFLEGACAGDAELRAAVEDLLEHDRAADLTCSFLTSPMARAAGELRSEALTAIDRLQGGTPSAGPALPDIPGYELLQELGRGGMGVVYQARQPSLNRIVALKMLLPFGSADAETLVRFRTEAEALARLNHPNVVPIYDIGESEGRPYFTMEYVAGPSLARLLNGRAQDVSASAQLVEVLARAVHAVHQCGIIHRDLKPANILLSTRHAAFGLPKITDFGLAKDQTTEGRLTRSGTTMGTPCYMAPEQARSSGAGAGPAADVYALGSVLYEMLTGRPPFDAETPAETIVQVLENEPLSPSRLRPRLPRDLVTICLKCLEKSPRRRYVSAWDLAEDLRRFQAGEPIRARPVGVVERAYRWCRRRPLVAALLALSTILAVAFVITVVVYDIRLGEALAKAETRTEEERQQLVQLNVNIGITASEVGDNYTAVLHFAAALRLDEAFPDRQRNHRTRLATALRQCPRLVRLLTLDGDVLCAYHGESGGWVATVGQDHLVEIRDLGTGRPVALGLKPPEAPVSGSFSADGRFLALVSENGTANVWNLRTGKLHQVPSGKSGPVRRVAFHPDGRILLTTHADSSTRLWDLTNQEPVALAGFVGGEGTFAALSDNGRWLFTLDGRHSGQVWDVGTGQALAEPLKLAQRVSLAAVSLDGRRVVLIGPDHALTAWDVPTAKLIQPSVQLPPDVSRLVLSPDAERVFTAGRDRTAQVWKVETGAWLAVFSPLDGEVKDAHFSADGRLVLTTDGAGKARVWDTATGQARTPPLGPCGVLTLATFGTDGKQVITVSKNGIVCLWELPRVPEMSTGTSSDREQAVTEPAAVDHGKRSIQLRDGRTIRVTQPANRALRPPQPADGVVAQAVFSLDGRRVVVTEDDHTARVWDTVTGQPVTPPLRHGGAVVCAAFSADGGRLITASIDRTARVWDAVTGEPLAPPLRHRLAIKGVAFHGDRAGVVHEGSVVSTWDLTPDPRPVAELVALAQVQAFGRIADKQQDQEVDRDLLRSTWARLHPAP